MISNPTDLPTVVFSLVRKSFTHQNGALIALAAAPSFTAKQFFELIMRDTDLRDIVIPLTIFAIMLIMYILVAIIDFYTGLSASKKEYIDANGFSKGYVNSDKLWSSVWKSLGVMLIAVMLTMFCLIFVILQMDKLHSIFLLGLVMFYIVVILFDLHSIGENQQRRFGQKPKIYVFLDEAAIVIKEGIINKIKKLF